MVGLIRGVSEGLGAVGGAAMIYSLSGLLLILPSAFPTCARSHVAICWPAACCLSAMKSASRCRWAMPPAASRPLRWDGQYLWPSLTILFAILLMARKAAGW